jgi:hypothetical protein
MKAYFQRALLVSLFALAWFGGGYLVGGAISTAFLNGPFFSLLAFQGAVVNTLLGLILMAIITFTEPGRHLFYEGSGPEGLTGLRLLIIFLLATPVLCAVVGLVWLGAGLIGRFFGLWKL